MLRAAISVILMFLISIGCMLPFMIDVQAAKPEQGQYQVFLPVVQKGELKVVRDFQNPRDGTIVVPPSPLVVVVISPYHPISFDVDGCNQVCVDGLGTSFITLNSNGHHVSRMIIYGR